MLRDPIQRYLSEWKQVQRGGTWLSTKLKCNGRQATLAEVPFCFKGNTLLNHLTHCMCSFRPELVPNKESDGICLLFLDH